MSILVALYSNVSHAYTVSDFSIQNSVLSKFPSVLSRFFQGRIGYWVKARKVLSACTLSPFKEKAKQWSQLLVSVNVNY